ncbi:hypothetical protein EJB05_26666, partial [Eragrostis curvula]
MEQVIRAPAQLDRGTRCYLVMLLLVRWFISYHNSLEKRGKGLRLTAKISLLSEVDRATPVDNQRRRVVLRLRGSERIVRKPDRRLFAM